MGNYGRRFNLTVSVPVSWCWGRREGSAGWVGWGRLLSGVWSHMRGGSDLVTFEGGEMGDVALSIVGPMLANMEGITRMGFMIG